MKFAHFVGITVFGNKDEEDLEKIERTMAGLCPFDIEEHLIRKKAIGFNEKEIMTYEIDLNKSGLVNKFIKNLMTKLDEDQKEMLKRQMERRLDERMHFYLRLEKEKLLEGKYYITDSGNCFHIKITIAAFPKKREIGLRIVSQMLSL
jgi:hypothetical protein